MPPRNTIDRVLARTDQSGDCWTWTGSISPEGYGKVTYQGSTKYVHRLLYETLVGPIPARFTLDHLCRVRSCCRPEHLEAVTSGENVMRGAHSLDFDGTCTKGTHDVTQPGSVYRDAIGKRHCRGCQRERGRRRRERARTDRLNRQENRT